MQSIINAGFKSFVLAVLLFFLTVVPSAAVGQATDEQPRILSIAQQRLQARITYSCRELPIDTVLMQLAEQAQIDIIKSPKVIGNVTVKITDVPLEEALSQILAAHGYTYIASETMLRVVPATEVADIREKLVTRIYRLTYANVCDVAEALQKFISKKGEIAINKGTSNLIVTDTESKIRAIDSFVEEIDRITPQVLVEARIYDITSNDSFILQKMWSIMRNTPVTAIEHAEESVKENVTTNITETTTVGSGGATTTTPSYGATETGFTNTDTETTTKTDSTILKGKPWVGAGCDPVYGGSIGFTILNDAVDIRFVLNMLQQEVEVELLANPRILVLDNETARFKIVREIPYEERSEGASSREITTIKFKDVGVKLDVTPHIARDGMIRLEIIPEFGVQEGTLKAGLEGIGAPQVNTRRLETTTLIKDGQTVVLGGLCKKDSRELISKVPIFGDLPFLGELFRSRAEVEETVELVIFITTRIITQPELSEEEKIRFKATKFTLPEPTKAKAQRDKETKKCEN